MTPEQKDRRLKEMRNMKIDFSKQFRQARTNTTPSCLVTNTDIGFTLDTGGESRLQPFFFCFLGIEGRDKKALPFLKLLPRVLNRLLHQLCVKSS
jgi:hypothetical protein